METELLSKSESNMGIAAAKFGPQDGLLTMTDASLADASPPDVLFVPGGLGTRALQHDDAGMHARH